MSNTAIKFENISKQYRLGLVSTKTLSHDLNRWWQTAILRKDDPYLKIGETNDRATKGSSEYVWALRDINFEVEQGDIIGIIGKNGAGKSTLLKILSRVTTPTTGTIKAQGRIASLLEVGTGFHQEMTGRENIYMNGAILGMTKAEISRKLDEIVDFAGVERYIDTPVKRYSSGMMVRLGFAVAAHLDPEILVVDEVLAVGDAEFQKKAIGKMQDVSKGEGRTVLFVSHNMASIKALCKKGVLLKDGSVAYSGEINDTISQYLKNSYSTEDTPISQLIHYHTNLINIKKILINCSENSKINLPKNNIIELVCEGKIDTKMNLDFEVRIKDENEILLATFAPSYTANVIQSFEKGNFELKTQIQLPEKLTQGNFYATIQITIPKVDVLATIEPIIINSEGYLSPNGDDFPYKWNGFTIL
ncbi:MAG: ABC transporter ATP-binding protein [Prevotellaceae bacterium]|jgi:lipopolysaccharide transport system ATP-binding protein|nr:ABC transporter ATP-binding protein [Prevotellaceae bacterium]